MRSKRRYAAPSCAALLTLALIGSGSASAQGVWTSRAPVPAALGREGACVAGSGAADVNGVAHFRIYIVSGFGPLNDSDTTTAYDTLTDTYATGLAPRPAFNDEGVGASEGGLIYCLGGRDPEGFGSADNDRYDPSTNRWTPLAPMPIAVAAESSAAVVGREIHVIGGRSGGIFPSADPKTDAHQVYDIGTGSWSFETALPGGPRSDMVAVAYRNRIYVMGGFPEASSRATAEVYIFDTTTHTWSPAPPLPVPLADASAAVIGGSIYVTGGEKDFEFKDTTFSDQTFRLDVESGVWSTVTRKPTATAETQAVGRAREMFVIGGGFLDMGAGRLEMVNESFTPEPEREARASAKPVATREVRLLRVAGARDRDRAR